MSLHTFELGGIHPPENKLSAAESIKHLPLPEQVAILLSQHLGVPAEPLVQKGDKVKVGDLIGAGRAFISANVHSSVSGTVAKIDEVIDTSGYRKKAIIIKVEGDEWLKSIDRSDTLVSKITLEPEAIIKRIKTCGIVGMGGACFPTHVKFMVPEGKKLDTLLINGVECEPFLTSDHRLMLERPDQILVGIRILMKAARVNRAVIGIEINKMDAIELFRAKIADHPGIEVLPLKVKYPQGAEKQLIKAVLNREVPSGKLPLDVGCVVNNVGTTVAVYEAVQKNMPLIGRVVTISGKGLDRTGNYYVRIGSSAAELLGAMAVELPPGTGKIISGGPMMGKALASMEMPLSKGSSGIILMDASDSARSGASNCIRCAKCIGVCPMGLEPYLLEKLARKEEWQHCEKNGVTDCIECGSCSYACPSSLPLLDYIRYGKGSVMTLQRMRK